MKMSIAIEDVPIGKPLPWDLYDSSDSVVLTKGQIVASREQIENMGGLHWILEEAVGAEPQAAFPPLGIKPQVGERLQFRFLNRSSPHYSARLIGYIANQSVLVTVPIVNGIPLILNDGDQIEVRMVTGSNIYIFKTAIQRLCVSPIHYMHLDYPAVMRAQKLRKSPRARASLGATATNAKGEQKGAKIVNLSPNGAQLHTTLAAEAGDSLHIDLPVEMDELKTTLNLEATVVNKSGLKGLENLNAYGISFNNAGTDNALWLQALVYRHIAEGGLA